MSTQFWYPGGPTMDVANLRLHADKLQLTGDDTGRLLHTLLDSAGADAEAAKLRAEAKDLNADLRTAEKALEKARLATEKLRTALEKSRNKNAVSLLSLLDDVDAALDEA